MPNVYVDLDLTSPGGNATAGNPWGWDEFQAGAIDYAGVSNVVFWVKGSHEFDARVYAPGIIGSQLRQWVEGIPWRMYFNIMSANGLEMPDTAVSGGIIKARYITAYGVDHCYLDMTNPTLDVYGDSISYCTLYLSGAGSRGTLSPHQAIDLSRCIIISAASQPLYTDYAGSTVSASYTNRDDFSDLTYDDGDGSKWSAVPPITYGFSYSAAPAWDAADLEDFRLGAPSQYGPDWASVAADSIHAQITADLKSVLSAISGIAEVSEMRSFFDRDNDEYIMLQELPVEYSADYEHTNDVTFLYNILYFGGTNDEKPNDPFTYQNRNIVADIIAAIMADRTRDALAQNTIVVSSGPGFYTDGDGNILPISFVSIDVQALVDANNPYNLA